MRLIDYSYSVLCTVIIIYCIVIIYIPSLKENGTEFVVGQHIAIGNFF